MTLLTLNWVTKSAENLIEILERMTIRLAAFPFVILYTNHPKIQTKPSTTMHIHLFRECLGLFLQLL